MTQIMLACSLMLLCTVAVMGQDGAKPSGPPKVGDLAPNFKLKGSDGKEYDLSSYRGKIGVVLAWYPRAFTGG
jgi:peroxiredoxin